MIIIIVQGIIMIDGYELLIFSCIRPLKFQENNFNPWFDVYVMFKLTELSPLLSSLSCKVVITHHYYTGVITRA